MTRFLGFALGIGLWATNAWAVPTAVFSNTLDDDAATTSTGGTFGSANRTYVAGVQGNAMQSTSNSTNAGAYARWNDATVSTIFSGWNNANGITVDHYFSGSNFEATSTSTLNQGFWAMVRRDNNTGQIGDSYFFTSAQTPANSGGARLRVAFSNDQNSQHKYTFSGAAANPGSQEYVNGINIPLLNNVIYRLTVSLGNGELKIYLDDIGGNTYSNATPIFTDNTIIPDGFNWQLPPAGAVSGSGGSNGRQTREMDIGIRGFGNTGNTINNFGGSMRNGTWIDEVNVYNGIYTPAEIPEPATALLLAAGALPLLRRRRCA